MAACVSRFQVMRISWSTKRVMALTPPTGNRVQAHGKAPVMWINIRISDFVLIA